MECDDSTGPFILTPKIIKEAQKRVTNGKKIVHGTLPEFIRMAREHLDEKKLVTVKGEMRHPQRAGVWTDLYAEVQATRMPLKYSNRRAEIALQRVAEPMATVAWMLGAVYPQFALDRANELLLQSHAHDSIGGCGVDAVADEVMFRFRQVRVLSGIVTEAATREIAGRIDTSKCGPEENFAGGVQPSAAPVQGVASAEIDIARDRKVQGFKICDLDGKEVASQIIRKTDFLATFNHPRNCRSGRGPITGNSIRCCRCSAIGCRVFKVVPVKGEHPRKGSVLTSPTSMENEHLKVKVNPNGTVDVTSKADGVVLRGQNMFEDRGDVGDYWVGAFRRKTVF